MIDRKLQPALVEINKIDFVSPKKYSITEDVELFHMSEVPNETAKIDLYFNGGKAAGPKGESSFVNGLLLSGTLKDNSTEINKKISYLGGFYDAGISMEGAAVSIYALRQNIEAVLDIILDSIANVCFEEHELNDFKNERKQRMKVSLGKVSFIAQREFQQKMFASHSNYASVSQLEDIDKIERNALIDFHKLHYLNGLTRAFVIANIDEQQIERIQNKLKSFAANHQPQYESNFENATGEFHTEKTDALQTAIRIGKMMFDKTHDDYLDFLILNTIIGDYFGSRLMSNIREDKGYTYGIGSSLVELYNTGYFIIATEVGKQHREAAINEIKNELSRLQTELVPVEELELVKNYMLGQLLKSADGPYAMSDLYLAAHIHGQDLNFYNRAIDAIKNITPERIQSLAKQYLNWNSLTIVSAG